MFDWFWDSLVQSGATPIHVDGLLHLATLAVAVTLGYVGLDRVEAEQQDLEKEITEVRESVAELLVRQGVVESGGEINFIYDFPGIYVLCHIAGIELNHGWLRPYHILCCQRHVPLLGYFRRRLDYKVVAVLAVISVIFFLLITAATIWSFHIVANRLTGAFLYVMFVGMLLWIIISVAASHKIRRIKPTCKALEREIDARLEKVYQTQIKRVQAAENAPDQTTPI